MFVFFKVRKHTIIDISFDLLIKRGVTNNAVYELLLRIHLCLKQEFMHGKVNTKPFW